MSSVQTCAKTGDRSFVGHVSGVPPTWFLLLTVRFHRGSRRSNSANCLNLEWREAETSGSKSGKRGGGKQEKKERTAVDRGSKLLTFRITRELCCEERLFKLETVSPPSRPFLTTPAAVSQGTRG